MFRVEVVTSGKEIVSRHLWDVAGEGDMVREHFRATYESYPMRSV